MELRATPLDGRIGQALINSRLETPQHIRYKGGSR